MGKSGCRSGVSQVVGRDVDRLNRGDRTLAGRGDTFLQLTHLGGQRRLVTNRRRDTAEQRRNLGAGLGEAEDVVDEEQHVLALFVAEVFGNGQCRKRDTGTGTRGLVHLAVDQGGLVENAGLFHLFPEVVPFTGPLTDTGENRVTTVLLGDVVDQLHDQNGLADTGAAEQADLTATGIRSEQVNNLDAGFKCLNSRGLFHETRRGTMNFPFHIGTNRTGFVNRLTDHVQDAAEGLGTNRHNDLLAGIEHLLTADQTVGTVHGDGPNRIFTQMLGNFQNQVPLPVINRGVGYFERVVDLGELAGIELNVDNRADDLCNASFIHDEPFLHVCPPVSGRDLLYVFYKLT